ncbi:hypothetical protein HDU92_002386 [Lobulomyces angularis]|nr:hypothetical protein HDU92_002386 [Lobulomyces angularis]
MIGIKKQLHPINSVSSRKPALSKKLVNTKRISTVNTTKSDESLLLNLPSEIILLIFKNLSIVELKKARLLSKYLKSFTNYILNSRLTQINENLEKDLKKSSTSYKELEFSLTPHLSHYRNFLRNLTSNEVTEATWYSSPPAELHTVCTCLCILKFGKSILKPNANLDNPTGSMLGWLEVKKLMGKYSFKNWFQDLRITVEKIKFENIKIVEKLIQQDLNITYERLREVSQPGYKMLIVVAAVLQFGIVNEDILTERRIKVSLEKRLEGLGKYLEVIRKVEVANTEAVVSVFNETKVVKKSSASTSSKNKVRMALVSQV